MLPPWTSRRFVPTRTPRWTTACRTRMSGRRPEQGLLDTNVVVLLGWVTPAELPVVMAISAITLAELSAGPHEVRPNDEQSLYDERAERARRTSVLQHAEADFDPIPFGVEEARIYGQLSAATGAIGREPRGRIADLMIASTAVAARLPLFTINPDDFRGLDELLTVVPVTRPRVPHEPARPTA